MQEENKPSVPPKFFTGKVIFWTIVVLTGCSTTKKLKTTHSEKSETNTTAQVQTTAVKNIEFKAAKQKDSSYKNTSGITIAFDNDLQTDNSYVVDPGFAYQADTVERENDYAGAAPKRQNPKPLNYTYNIGGNIISSPVPIKNISLLNQQTGKITAVEITQQKTHDSSAATANITRQVKQQVTDISKTKSTSTQWWILIVIALAVGIAVLWYFFPALFRRKKQPPA